MDLQTQNHFRKLLLQERQEVISTLKRMEEHYPQNASTREYMNELSAYDNHPADMGTEMFMASMQINLENNEEHRLHEIDKALDRIDKGEYGLCQKCGDQIVQERLEILPEVDTCMDCEKDEVPLYNIDDNRPVEERLLRPPFGSNYKDNDDYTGFDGEDAYQQVARFNEINNDPSFSTGDNLGVYDEGDLGIVEEIDKITVEHYKTQLPGEGNIIRRKKS